MRKIAMSLVTEIDYGTPPSRKLEHKLVVEIEPENLTTRFTR